MYLGILHAKMLDDQNCDNKQSIVNYMKLKEGKQKKSRKFHKHN